jgi:1-phosphatidylinositol phosphodiesterase
VYARLGLFAALAACSGSQGEPAWMAHIDDARTIAELSIPGTHDSGAMYEPAAGLAKCQKLTIAAQLAAGVRYFDLRCRHVEDAFLIYHGAIDQNQTFDEVLATMYAFLDAHPSETILASVKEEAVPANTTRSFEATFDAYVAPDADRWVLAPSLPVLGDVRGKLVLLRRFSAAAVPLGIDATQWADNATFTITDADAHLRIEDNYMVNDNDAKWGSITALLADASAGDPTTWMLTYTSGYQTISGLPDIPIVADDINARLDALLADPATAHAHLGTLAMDLVTASRVAAIIATNAK